MSEKVEVQQIQPYTVLRISVSYTKLNVYPECAL